MCKILNKTRRKSFTGFKVAHKIGNRYYSPATGVEYKVGPVTPATGIIQSRTSGGGNWSSHILNEDSSFFCKEMYGKTSVFKSLEDLANTIYELFKNEVVLKMTISGGIWETEMITTSLNRTTGSVKMFAGTKILSMKESELNFLTTSDIDQLLKKGTNI